MSILRFLYQTLCAFLQIKGRQHIEQNLHSVAGVMPQGWDLGVLGWSKTLAWGFGTAPHRPHILVLFCFFSSKFRRRNDQNLPRGYPNFFRIHRLGPIIYRSPPKNIRNFKHPKKIFEILATPKNIPILYLDLKKDPKLHRNDPQTSPIL